MKRFTSIIFALFLLCPVFSAYNSWNVPDSSEIRKTLTEKWFDAPLINVRLNQPEIISNPAGEKFQVSLEETDTTYSVIVSSSTFTSYKFISASKIEYSEKEAFTGTCKGSWVLIKNKANDKPLCIRYYCTSNSEAFVQFSPKGKTSTADLIIFNNYAARGVATGVPFEKFYTASFDEVLKLTQKSIPWNYIDVKDKIYDNIHSMAAVINQKCPLITYTDDVMYDENNNLIKITTGEKIPMDAKSDRLYLSSAGFVKWIADGIVKPITGTQLNRSSLITETVKVNETSWQGKFSRRYPLYFSLDWVRNLSSKIISVYTGKNYNFKNSGVDVTRNLFSAINTSDGIKSQVTFIENTGYSVNSLKSLLYVLAATESGSFYFAAIRETDRTVSPEIKVFNDCAVFFPYFDEKGVFGCYVFINGKPKALDDFILYYSQDFVYLTRVRASERFYPE